MFILYKILRWLQGYRTITLRSCYLDLSSYYVGYKIEADNGHTITLYNCTYKEK